MYDRILVPLDGSHFSEEVIPYALTLTEATGAKLALLRVVDRDSQKNEAEDYVTALASDLNAEGIVRIREDDLSSDILAEARRVPNTLVAITTHGRGGLLTVILGSVAREIVLASDFPVLVYRPKGKSEGHKPTAITTVLLPLDGTSLAEDMGERAAAWAKALKATLTVVQALPPQPQMHEIVRESDVFESSYISRYATDIARKFNVPIEWEVLHGDPVNSISTHFNNRHDVLAVMATRGHSALQTAVLGSVTSGLVQKSGMPIILQAPNTTDADNA